ncbi:MAG TPA: high-affinity nickel-transport family protein [Polyangiales bacterium]|nr:high-affinity nickel-transport family protein [Polyangiales bacterium]
MTLLSILGLGFVLGMRHATDSDHVVAVSTIVSRERSAWAATLIGALWGVGHTFTIMAVGGAIIVFDLIIPARLGLSMELSVGVMLVVLGALNLSGAWRRIEQVAHAHEHHDGRAAHRAHADRAPALGLIWLARPLLVGVVHGLAGSAAVALLVLTTIRSVHTALLYLAVFGLGTVVGMAVLTTAFAAPLAFAAAKSDRINHYMARATGALSLAFGMLVLYKIGIVDGLFTSHPHWTPQ